MAYSDKVRQLSFSLERDAFARHYSDIFTACTPWNSVLLLVGSEKVSKVPITNSANSGRMPATAEVGVNLLTAATGADMVDVVYQGIREVNNIQATAHW